MTKLCSKNKTNKNKVEISKINSPNPTDTEYLGSHFLSSSRIKHELTHVERAHWPNPTAINSVSTPQLMAWPGTKRRLWHSKILLSSCACAPSFACIYVRNFNEPSLPFDYFVHNALLLFHKTLLLFLPPLAYSIPNDLFRAPLMHNISTGDIFPSKP